MKERLERGSETWWQEGRKDVMAKDRGCVSDFALRAGCLRCGLLLSSTPGPDISESSPDNVMGVCTFPSPIVDTTNTMPFHSLRGFRQL